MARGFKYEKPHAITHQKNGNQEPFDYTKFLNFELSRLNQSSMTRSQEKFVKIYKFINTRIKTASRKIDNIKQDVIKAEEQLIYKEYGDAVLAHPVDKKWRTDKIEANGALIKLDGLKTLAETLSNSINYKKAKNTIAISDKLIEKARELNESLFPKVSLLVNRRRD